MLEKIWGFVKTNFPDWMRKHPRFSFGVEVASVVAPLCIFGTTFWFNIYVKSELTVTINDLKTEVGNKDKEITELNNEKIGLMQELTPFKTIALEYYPSIESQSLSLLAQRMGQIELDTISLLDYQEVSKWNFFGDRLEEFGEKNKIIQKVDTKVSGWTDGYLEFIKQPDSISTIDNIVCDFPAREHYLKQIEIAPLYPFPYFIISECLKKDNTNSNEWETYRIKALKIVRKTSSIPNHHLDHDSLLSNLEGRY